MITRNIVVQGLRITVSEEGNGPPVLLIPGLGLSHAFYTASFSVFAAAGYRLIVPDPPGFGGSAAPDGRPDIPEMARLLAATADTLAIGNAAWIGHSISAQTCLMIAACRPDLVSRLVLIAPTGAEPRARRLRQAAGLVREAVRAPLRTVAAVAADYLRTSPRRYLSLWMAASRDDVLSHARRVACPALVVVGTQDPVVPAAAVARLLTALRRGRLVHVPATGHALPREDPAAMHRVVLPFLACSD